MTATSRNILILTPQLPYPPHQGTSLRNYHIIRGLAQHHQVTLLSFVEANQSTEPEAIRPLLDNLHALHTLPAPTRTTAQRLRQLLTTRLPDMAHRLYDPGFAARLRDLLAANIFNVVQVEGIELARYMADIRVASPGSVLIFDDHNAETELQRRNMLTDFGNPRRWVAAAYSLVQVARLRRFERGAMMQADGVTAVSDTDRSLLQTLLGDNRKPLLAIPNSIDVQAYHQDETADGPVFDLVFTGKMDYRPNVDAMLWFADEIWPQIRASQSQATWAIVGQKPHARLERLREMPGVVLTGWVESVRPYLANAAVVVMPFRVGSGTRLKLIEAMAAGKAIVSTRIGAEGFPVTHDRELLLADEPAGFATAVVHLLSHPADRARLGQTATQFAARYDWRSVIPQFEALYEQLCGGDAEPGDGDKVGR